MMEHETAAEKTVQVPVKLFGIHARYASAAYIAAAKAGVKPTVEAELLAFKSVMETNDAFGTFVSNPTVSRDEKVAAIEKLYDGSKTTHVTKNTLSTLAANARLNEVDKVIDAYLAIMKADRKEVDAVITSAEPLSAKQTKQISAALAPHLKAGEKVKLSTVVDAALIGGLTVQIGDSFMDLSAASKIKTLQRSI